MDKCAICGEPAKMQPDDGLCRSPECKRTAVLLSEMRRLSASIADLAAKLDSKVTA